MKKEKNLKTEFLLGKVTKIPEDFKVLKLKDIVDVDNKYRKAISSKNRIKGIYPYCGATKIQDYIQDYSFSGKRLLIGEDGADWSGKSDTTYIMEGKFNVNNHVHVLKEKDVPLNFLKYYLNYFDLSYYITGAVVKKLTKSSLLDIDVFYDEKNVNKIVEILDKQQSLIDSYKEKLSILEKQESYYQDELLSGRIRIKLNSESEKIAIDKGFIVDGELVEGKEKEFEEWLSVDFKDKVEFYKEENMVNCKLNNLNKTKPFSWEIYNLNDEKINIIKSGINKYDGEKKYFATGGVGYSNELNNFEYFSYDDRPSRANMEPLKNSIWFARMKDTEKYIHFKDNYSDKILSTGFLGIKCENILSSYVFNYIKSESFIKYKNKLASGSTQEAINNKNAELLQVLYPENNIEALFISICLEKFETIKNNINEKIKIEEKKMEFLMDELLSGRIRIKE